MYLDSYITTSEMPLYFDSLKYHSYLTTDEGVIDISNNSFYLNDFNKLYMPKEILKIKSSEFKKICKEIIESKKYIDNGMTKVLVMALNNKSELS